MEMSLILDRTPRQIFRYLERRYLKIGNFSEVSLSNFSDKKPCVFVLSTGRVGSQTLASLLNLSSNVVAFHEPNPKLYKLSCCAYRYRKAISDDASVRNVFRAAFETARESLLLDALQSRRGYVETSPQGTFLASVISQLVPNSRFIHLVRDPRAVISSGMRRKWYEGNPYDQTRIEPNTSEMQHAWKTYSSFQKNVWLWAETNNMIVDFLDRLPSSRKMLIHSEDIFSGNQKVTKEIFSFIGSKLPSEKRINKILAKKLNAQKSGSFVKPEEWDEEMHAVLCEAAKNIAMKLGYDLKSYA